MLLLLPHVNAQDKRILMTLADEKISVDEFEAVYNKNNFYGKSDYSRKSIDDYLNLFINYKLKVHEAYAQGLDTVPELKMEYLGYEKQLFDSHLDKQVLDKLIKQEYLRSKTDVAVSHIYVKSTDSNALEIIKSAYQQLQNGKTFEEVALQYSQDEFTRNKGGNLGYFNVLQIGFPELEDAAYALKKGMYSSPISTSIGYHIVKVNDIRPAYGKIKVAIIKKIIKPNSTDVDKVNVKKIMDSLYAELKKGVNFNELAVTHSEDYFSNFKGGELDWFGINTYATPFEEAAFALQSDGDYTTPIMTSSAYYIIKRLEKKQDPPLEDMENYLRQKLMKSQMYNKAFNVFIDSLKGKYNFSINNKLYAKTLDTLYKNIDIKSYASTAPERNTTLYSLDGKNYPLNKVLDKFITHLNFSQKFKTPEDRIQYMMEKTIQDDIVIAYKNNLSNSNEEYRSLMEEYKNGVLIFDLIKREVWDKTNADSSALTNYFLQNKENYKWNKRAAIRLITLSNEQQLKSALKLLKKNPSATNNQLSEIFEKDNLHDIAIEDMIVEDNKSEIAKFMSWKPGVNKSAFSKDNATYIFQTKNVIPEQNKSFEETKGFVMAGYQEYLEKQWIDRLKQKYPIIVNKEILNSLVKP
jgi:peptidyl-prolyl cis-trans isomerase SurA